MKLLTLNIENFKGITSLELNPNGKNLDIHGANATGKTSIYDAFTWLLFNKDSTDRSQFEIKPQNEKGEVKDKKTITAVSAVVEHQNETVELRKTLKEKWVKKRSTVHPIFDGHETTYQINEVPVKAREYEERVSSLCGTGIFKLLANPLHFNSIDWKERRKSLMDICENVHENTILGQDKELFPLLELKGCKTVEQLRAVKDAKRKELTKELDALPIRIKDAQQSITVPDGDTESISKEIADITLELLKVESKLRDVDTDQSKARLETQIADKEILLKSLALSQQENNPVAKRMSEVQDNIFGMRLALNGLNNELMSSRHFRETEQASLQKLREEYAAIHSREWGGSDVCATCKQSLPAEALKAAVSEFNHNKSLELSQNFNEGKAIALATKGKEDTIATLQEKHDNLTAELSSSESLFATLQNQKDKPFVPTTEMQTVMESIRNLKEILGKTTDSTLVALKENLEENRLAIKRQLDELNRSLLLFEQEEKNRTWVAKLESQVISVSSELEQVEKHISLCDLFSRKKIDIMQSEINSKFKHAKFSLFEKTIAGDLVEVCKTTYKGVSYSDLNTASKLNIGLDVISTLSKHYSFSAPIFIDNAESVTDLWGADENVQIIRLVVSGQDTSLRIEQETEDLTKRHAV